VKRFSMRVCVLVFACLAGLAICRADELAAVTGLVTDPNGRSVPGVTVIITNLATNVVSRTVTNDQGIYRVASLQPGIYRMTLDKDGFKSIVKSGVELHVQDVASINFEFQIGSVNETVTVEAGGLVMNTTDATVSTVVDRQFAENLPMNGRSFQTLIQLTPGVVLTSSNGEDAGQFSVNGQRAASNYWMVDGVSANIGTSASSGGNGLGGALGSTSAFGGTNSLVSVDALQEFRIQTSTYAPEFGRTPGGQISIVTRSGTNQFHGSLFDYLRNDVLDANDWFADSAGLRKPEERQNDFGGTFSGPILRDRTFFFFSYEGLRLRLPQVALTTVPDVAARQNAVPAMQPYLNAFPMPNGPEDPAFPGAAQFNASFSNKATLDAYSIRIDHRLGNKLNLFGRYNYSPSELDARGGGAQDSLNELDSARITTQTATVGGTWLISPATTNDLRFNYSRVNGSTSALLDTFGGAVPLASLGLPSPFTSQNATFGFFDFSLSGGGGYAVGKGITNLQRQVNIVDSMSIQRGSHSLKFGVDFRRLSPVSSPSLYTQGAIFFDVPSAEIGNLGFSELFAGADATLLFRNLGVFAQDTWRVFRRFTVTYGLRWDVDFSPATISGPSFPAVTGFNLNNLSQLALAPVGTPAFKTPYGNVAPRLGVAYQLHQGQAWQTVIRGGFGVFFDLADSELGNLINQFAYPFGAQAFPSTSTFPLDPVSAARPPITSPNAANQGTLIAFDPNLKLPYSLEWNTALEQTLGSHQTLSASYIGASGRRLIQTAVINLPNPNIGKAQLVTNSATSDYQALQLQFQRLLSHGLQSLASYTWSHSIDTASAGSFEGLANSFAPTLNANANRGPSDFDVRNAFSAGLTYDIPGPKTNVISKAILGGWSVENIVQARSAPPADIFTKFNVLFAGRTEVRPDVVPGRPFYLFGPQFPGGKAINPAAFTLPPLDPTTRQPARQGDLGRNVVRGFGATQWDFAVHRDFPIHESVKLQFRAEMFNVLNHPNFGPPFPQLGSPKFGQATQMLGESLNGGTHGSNLGGGAFNPLYQIGGPRSIQFALKLAF
jgi:hypothetical protein